MYTPCTLNADTTTTTTTVVLLLQLQLMIWDISFTEAELQPMLFQIWLLWQRGSVGKKFGLQFSMAYLRKRPYRRKDFTVISYRSRVIAHLVLNSVAMATRVGGGKISLAASRRYLLQKPNYSLFCPKFRGFGCGKIWFSAFDGPSPKTLL